MRQQKSVLIAELKASPTGKRKRLCEVVVRFSEASGVLNVHERISWGFAYCLQLNVCMRKSCAGAVWMLGLNGLPGERAGQPMDKLLGHDHGVNDVNHAIVSHDVRCRHLGFIHHDPIRGAHCQL